MENQGETQNDEAQLGSHYILTGWEMMVVWTKA